MATDSRPDNTPDGAADPMGGTGPADGTGPAYGVTHDSGAEHRPAHPPAPAETGTTAFEADTAGSVGIDPDPAGGVVGNGPSRKPSSFAVWRGRRPFWGGLVLTLAGAEVMLTMLQGSLEVAVKAGAPGIAGYLLPAIMMLCGLLALFSPGQRLFYSLVGLLSSLGSWVTSNLGGFIVGMLLGLLGATLIFGWVPEQGPRRRIIRDALRRGRRADGGPAGRSAAA